MDKYQDKYSSLIQESEFEWIKTRREMAKRPDVNNTDTIGIALSGGGIRSATFNLGVLQALENAQKLKNIDYMSTASGGGYIGSALTWFKSKCPDKFPFGTKRADHNRFGGQVVSWIRSHSSFLTPGNGINLISLLSAIVTGTFINLMIVVPVFMLFLYSLCQTWLIPELGGPERVNGFELLLHAGNVFLGLTIFTMILTALSTSIATERRGRLTERLRKCVTALVTLFMGCYAIGLIPFFHQQLSMLTKWLVHASFSLSAVGMAISVISAYKTKNQNSVIAPLMVSLGLVLTCLGFILVAFHQVMNWQQIPDYFYVFILLSALLAIGCNINLVSMHGFYRNRLRDAFMPYQLPQDSGHVPSEISTWHASQMCYLKDLPITDAPFHIINCNVELTGSTQSKYRNRTGDCFSFTPLYSGATATGYRGTDVYLDGKVDLASVCAISGAAVATNTAATRSKPVNFLMAILNLRLGCWLKNPKALHQSRFIRPLWYSAMFKDMFGSHLDENETFIHLSDGGHFENLGVYELVRRKTKLIFAFDSGADPDYQFQDLGKLTELIRVDFGAKLIIDVNDIPPNQQGESKASWAIGEIKYADENKSSAIFVYVKSSISDSGKLSEDINSYKRQHPQFPHQSTANQFFNEAQFEAYRELGFQITHRMIKHDPKIAAML
ncbi:patatin-like phospholipase family protein [Thalassotalea atypica]|uniref:patatin-like phospholipase family protein n=1 Tax=Thalassotalea atypica TaxID=2054316 RepID=UPI0025745A80|nr:patatin-like phospholipase family protein [Thalassotalea atypica]